MKKKQKNKIKPNGWGTPMNLAIAAGVLLGLTVWFSPTNKVEEMPEIIDVKGLTTASEELDKSDPEEMDTLMLQLEQDFSTF